MEHCVARKASPLEKRPASPERARGAAAPHAAQLLQRRLGNRGAAAHLSRQSAGIQASSLTVSSPHDAAEREAVSTATAVMQMPTPASTPAASDPPPRRLEIARLHVQRTSEGPGTTDPQVTGEIHGAMSGGAPLSPSVRGFMEPRLGADFGGVRIHTDEKSAKLNQQVSAKAFTVGSHVFFGKGAYQPDTQSGKELIAHELTHTIQQGAAPQKDAVQRRELPEVTRQSPRAVQRLGISDALDYIADKANVIPGFRMFTILLGVNPINMSPVARTAANVLRAVIEFLPGGGLMTQALENSGIFDKVGGWVDQQLKTLGMVGGSIKQALMTFLDSLSWTDIFHLGDVWARAKRIFTEPIDRIINFAKGLVNDIITFIKDAILMPIARLAATTPAWDLLIAVLGKNPITGEPVARTAETLIPGFLKLIGQQAVWENAKKANAIPRLWAWFQGALSGLMAFVTQIPTLFINALKSLELVDIVLVPRAFAKIVGVFGGFFVKFVTWAGQMLWTLLELIFEVVSPAALKYIKKTGSALKSILQNPLPFVGNLVKAAKLGFQNFADHIGAHLKAGLIDWLTGSLPGVYIPKAFELGEIVKFVFSVLGLSWANVRQKLVKVVGETAVKAMETGFDIVVTLVTEGPAAAWDKIKDKLSELKDQVISGIIDFVVTSIVQKAVPKLIAMFIPGAGFISAIISIYDTIMVFVNKIATIIQVVTAFIDSIVAIAAGQIQGAANKVESILSRLLSLAINFLAGFLGLGKVADKIMGVIQKVRAVVDKGIDALINWIVGMAKKLFAKVFGKEDKPDDRTPEQKQADLTRGLKDAEALQRKPGVTEDQIRAALPAIKDRYRLVSLTLVIENKDQAKERVHIEGSMSPPQSTPSTEVVLGEDGPTNIKISRPGFRKSLKDQFRDRYPGSHVGVRLAAETDRRHIISSDEMAKHYEAKLNGLKWSEAKAILVKKGTPVNADPPKNVDILTAAVARHRDFFNHLENLWPGDASENRSIGADRDPPPHMTVAAADTHAKQMYDAFGLD
jgi:hypothetical protein